jgi:phospholipase/carboxylesterase
MRLADLDPPIEIETGDHPRACVIWLHGLGADGNDFVPLVPELRLPGNWPVRFIFPHAPYRPVTVNNGAVMRAWYDINWGEGGFYQNQAQLKESVSVVDELVAREEKRGIPGHRVVLAGFSQGGAVVMQALMQLSRPVAGVIALSAPVTHLEDLLKAAPAINAGKPILLAHGTYDDIVPYRLGEQSHRLLEGAGWAVQWLSYPMGHSVCAEEVDRISGWLQQVLSPC